MRIAVVDTYYPAFVAEHYRRRPALRSAPYEQQLASLLSRSFGTSDAYSHYLGELGHDAIDLAVSCYEVQAAWAHEHGGSSLMRHAARLPTRLGIAARFRFLHDVANAQIEAFDPQVVYLQDLWFFRRDELDAFRRDGRLVVGQIASRAPGPELLGGFDLITTSFPHFVTRFREAVSTRSTCGSRSTSACSTGSATPGSTRTRRATGRTRSRSSAGSIRPCTATA